MVFLEKGALFLGKPVVRHIPLQTVIWLEYHQSTPILYRNFHNPLDARPWIFLVLEKILLIYSQSTLHEIIISTVGLILILVTFIEDDLQ